MGCETKSGRDVLHIGVQVKEEREGEVLQSRELDRQGCKLDPKVHFVFYHTSIAPDASTLAGHNGILLIFGRSWTKSIIPSVTCGG